MVPLGFMNFHEFPMNLNEFLMDCNLRSPIFGGSLGRNLEPELKRRCASKGGAAWVQLTVDPVERLRSGVGMFDWLITRSGN